jgi:acyl-CoA synthetase (AMP-forming)/AMP-acid ligase II
MYLAWCAALITGAGIALGRKFSVSGFWQDVTRHRATSFLYIGELCRYLLNRPPQPGERDHCLRVAVGNGMGSDIWQEFQERFDVPVIREFYGATEGIAVTLNLEGRPGMIGRLSPGQLVVRCDLSTGEIRRDAKGRCQNVRPGEVGLLLGRIQKLLPFDGYVERKATSKKILLDVLKPGDRYFDTGDLVHLHEDRWLSFADRAGDTFRWKGENVSTNEVEVILDDAPGVLEANVYGVKLPTADGRAGMAAIRADETFDLEGFADHVRDNLAKYQRPLFLRLLRGEMRATSTFGSSGESVGDYGARSSLGSDVVNPLRGSSRRQEKEK